MASERSRPLSWRQRRDRMVMAMWVTIFRLLARMSDFILQIETVPSGSTMQVFAGHSSPVQCGEFTPDGTFPFRLVLYLKPGIPYKPTYPPEYPPNDAGAQTGPAYMNEESFARHTASMSIQDVEDERFDVRGS